MSNKDIETNINENTEKSETPKKKNIVHVFRPQNTQNGGNKGRRSGGNRQNSGQGKQMQANNGRPAKRPAAQNTATGEAQAPKRTEKPAAERAQGRRPERNERPDRNERTERSNRDDNRNNRGSDRRGDGRDGRSDRQEGRGGQRFQRGDRPQNGRSDRNQGDRDNRYDNNRGDDRQGRKFGEKSDNRRNDRRNEDELKEQLKDMAEKFGIKYEDSKVKKQGGLDREILEWIQEKEGGIANEYLYFNECSISEKGIQVIVKDNKDTVIIFSPSLVLEKCQKENEYDQIVLIAKQLQEMFPKICGVDKYQYDINGGDYTIDGRQKWRIAFVLKKESVEEKNIINYNFHRIEVSLDENNNVYSITIHNENLNNKIGDYPIITVEEAKNRLLEQRYWTSATYPPNQDNISKIELIYKTSNYHKYFAPYYCF